MPKDKQHQADSETPVFFYEREFYIFSNFSSFAIKWKGELYPTSEHAYHSEKFTDEHLKEQIRTARSAHTALQFTHANKTAYRENWNEIKVAVMKKILTAKVEQHPYVRQKLLETGKRPIIEDSPTDAFWGWGPNQEGENNLGKIWMEIREEINSERI